jgi:hypothetical protein
LPWPVFTRSLTVSLDGRLFRVVGHLHLQGSLLEPSVERRIKESNSQLFEYDTLASGPSQRGTGGGWRPGRGEPIAGVLVALTEETTG